MTIEEAREYWSRRLERAAGYSDEHWDAEERHAHKEYIDALKHAVTALAICREREEAESACRTGRKLMIICKDCRCFHPVTVSDRYCGECVIGDTRNAIEINAEITGCCLFEPKQPKKPKPLTNGDRIRHMTDEELSVFLGGIADNCSYNTCDNCPMYGACVDVPLSRDKWLKQEVQEDE